MIGVGATKPPPPRTPLEIALERTLEEYEGARVRLERALERAGRIKIAATLRRARVAAQTFAEMAHRLELLEELDRETRQQSLPFTSPAVPR